MLECRKCNSMQPEEEFYVIRKTGGRRAWCRTCVKANVTQWQRDNPDRVAAKWLRCKLKNRYGITPHDRDDMFVRQGGKCAICGSAPHPVQGLDVDHCHETGRVRGLLCAKCNQGIGYFEDSPERIRRAVAYLEINRPK